MSGQLPEGVPEDHPVVLFDGVCNLCAGSVKFLIERDDIGEMEVDEREIGRAHV